MAVASEALDGQLKRAKVGSTLPNWARFAIISDEGPMIGGKASAPNPLSYLCAGISFCLLSHAAVLRKTWSLDLRSIKVELRQRFAANPRTVRADDYWGRSPGIDVRIMIESDEDENKIVNLFTQVINSCMALQAIVQPTSLDARLHLNGREIETAD
ncbi:MAG: OsmC-related (seleno)protein [Parvularculaceae bacterium]